MMQKSVLILLITGMIITGCKNKKQVTPVNTKAIYELDKDTSVYSGEMKRYWLVLLKKGNNRTQDSITAAHIQAAHIRNINRLAKEGKIIMAGPMGTDGDLRGIFLMDAKDSTEIASLVNTDTAVITGRLKIEYYPWWSEKGKYIFK